MTHDTAGHQNMDKVVEVCMGGEDQVEQTTSKNINVHENGTVDQGGGTDNDNEIILIMIMK